MQTERVTFLTTPDHKAALDAFAANSGMSVGRVVREATTRYIAHRHRATRKRHWRFSHRRSRPRSTT